MAEDGRNDFGLVDEIDAEAIGEPGKRTFRLVAERGENTASLWIEKEQLQVVGQLLEQHLARLAGRSGSDTQTLLTLAARFPARATVDFRIGRLAVGLDEVRGHFQLSAHAIEDPDGDVPGFSCIATPPQMRALVAKIADVVVAGRPRCPLCGAPMEGTHVCPKANGHVH